jgi:tetratricopeptide (TPR) repeat protein
MKLITGIIFALGAAVAAARERAPAGATFAGGPLVTADENAPGLAVREQWFTDDPADSLYRAARETLNKGDYRRAATLFRQVVDRYPQSSYVADALYYQAFALARLGTDKDLRQALVVLDEQRKRFPEAADGADVRTLVTRIQGQLAKNGDPAAVKSLIDAAKGLDDLAKGTDDLHQDLDEMRSNLDELKADFDKGDKTLKGDKGLKGGRDARRSNSSCPNDDDDESDMRIAALNALLQMDSDRAMPILKQVLARRDTCSEVLRRKAVFLVAQKQTSESADLLINAARNDPDPEVRQQAVFWLSEVRSDRALAALDSLLRESKDPELQEKAIFAISNTNTARGGEILRKFAESSASEELRAKAVFWLGQSTRHNPENAAFLRQLFDKTQSEEIQGAIVQAIAEGASEENVRWLLSEVLNTKQPVETRKKALFWAGQQRRFDVNLLLPLYEKVTEPELKEHLIFVLAERRESSATDKLIDIAKHDKDREMRKKALFWLAQKNDPRVKQLLMEIIDQ